MTVNFYGKITDFTNSEKTFSPKEPSNIKGLFAELSDRYGEQFTSFLQSNETCIILVNGKGIKLTGGPDTLLHPDDKIEILPFVDAG